jgi:hypothetical protein
VAELTFRDAVIRGLGSVKYDRFLTPSWYVYLAGSAERNDRKRLNLRSWVGPGVGYQVFDSPTVRLQVETGTGYVHENFDDRILCPRHLPHRCAEQVAHDGEGERGGRNEDRKCGHSRATAPRGVR